MPIRKGAILMSPCSASASAAKARALEAALVLEEPVHAGLEQQREAAEALGHAALDHLGQPAEGALILENEPIELGRVGAHVAELLEHLVRRLVGRRALAVVAGRAERTAAPEALGDPGTGVERVVARVGTVRTAGVALDRERGRAPRRADPSRAQDGTEHPRAGRDAHEPLAPALGLAREHVARQSLRLTAKVTEKRNYTITEIAAAHIVRRRIGQRVLALARDEDLAGQERAQALDVRPAPHALEHDRVEAPRAFGRPEVLRREACERSGERVHRRVALDHRGHELGLDPHRAQIPRDERQDPIVEKRSIPMAVQAQDRDPLDRCGAHARESTPAPSLRPGPAAARHRR